MDSLRRKRRVVASHYKLFGMGSSINDVTDILKFGDPYFPLKCILKVKTMPLRFSLYCCLRFSPSYIVISFTNISCGNSFSYVVLIWNYTYRANLPMQDFVS